MEKRDFKLTGSWKQAYEFATRTDKNKNYISQLDRDIDVEHDAIMRMKVLEFQDERRVLDNSTLSELSQKAFDEASSILGAAKRNSESGTPPIARAILEMGIHTQEYIMNDDDIRYIVMGNIFTEGLSDDDIDFLQMCLSKYGVEYFPEQQFMNIVLFSIHISMAQEPGRLDELSSIYRKRLLYNVKKGLTHAGKFSDAAFLGNYPFWQRAIDFLIVEFK